MDPLDLNYLSKLREYSCSECNRCFSRNYDLKRHFKLKHDSGCIEKFTCAECFKDFRLKYDFFRHLKVHGSKPKCEICSKFVAENKLEAHLKRHHREGVKKSYSKIKNCPVCDFKAHKKADILKHFSDDHGTDVFTEKLLFDNIDDFDSWKFDLVMKENVTYTLVNSYNYKDPTKFRKIYKCHRSGSYVPSGKQKRSIKVLGTNKINGYCPSQIDIRNTNSGVEVLYTKTHFGHSAEAARQRLDKKEKEVIAEQLAMGVPLDTILTAVQSPENQSLFSRSHTITRKDLYNIAKCYNLSYSKKNRKNQLFKEEILQEAEDFSQSSIDAENTLEPLQENEFQEIVIHSAQLVDQDSIIIEQISPEPEIEIDFGQIEQNFENGTEEMKTKVLQEFMNVLEKAKSQEHFNLLSKTLSFLSASLDSLNN